MTISGRLPISEIMTNGGTQSRGAIIDGVVNDYMELLDVLPPVVVFHDGEAYWLGDGFHRLRAFEKAGQHDIPAEIRQGTRRDAILFSVGANAQHGLRRTRADKQRAVLTLLHDAEWGAWSDSEIARRCNVSHTMVATLRSSIAVPLEGKSSVTCKVASERTYKTKHGRTATMKTAGIGGNRQREPKPARDRPHQQVVAPVEIEEPAELDNPALDAAEHAVKRRRRFLALWEEMTPADREWASQTISHWKNSLPAHDSETGEIIDDIAVESSPPIEAASLAGYAASMSEEGMGAVVSSSQSIPVPGRFFDPIKGCVVDARGIPVLEFDPQQIKEAILAIDSAVPLADEAPDATCRLASGADLSATGADEEPVAGEILTASGALMPGLPAFLDRRGRS